jgi:hypothetical protein
MREDTPKAPSFLAVSGPSQGRRLDGFVAPAAAVVKVASLLRTIVSLQCSVLPGSFVAIICPRYAAQCFARNRCTFSTVS